MLTLLTDLELVATDPKYHGQGAGTLLLQYGCSRPDEDAVEAYLEASPDAVRLYEKMGFVEAQRSDTLIEKEGVPGVWYRNLFMIRQPSKNQVSPGS